jgi:hypothetical protein
MPRRKRIVQPLQVEQLEPCWCPSYSLITSRAALAGTDSVNWGNFGPAGTLVANPSTILSNGGLSINVSKAVSGSFRIDEQLPAVVGASNSWNGNFAPGDLLLYTNNFGVDQVNPVTLDFGATAVAAGGAQIQTDSHGKFTAKVEAFDAGGNSLASFTENGDSTNTRDNSAIFIGISSTSATIHRISLSITKAGNSGLGLKPGIGDFAINKFDFRTSPLAVTALAAPSVGRAASAVDLTPVASSLIATEQSAILAPPPGPVPSASQPANRTGVLPASTVSYFTHAPAADAVFAASHPATIDDDAWLFRPWSPGSLELM